MCVRACGLLHVRAGVRVDGRVRRCACVLVYAVLCVRASVRRCTCVLARVLLFACMLVCVHAGGCVVVRAC